MDSKSRLKVYLIAGYSVGMFSLEYVQHWFDCLRLGEA